MSLSFCCSFTSEAKEEKLPEGEACVCVTTFTMISHAGKRSEHGEKVGKCWKLYR